MAGVTFDNVKYGQSAAATDADVPLTVTDGAQAAAASRPATGRWRHFTVDPPVFAPEQNVTFTAKASPGARYTWLFGDGTEATGRSVSHRFADAEGTELDGSHRRGPLQRSAARDR